MAASELQRRRDVDDDDEGDATLLCFIFFTCVFHLIIDGSLRDVAASAAIAATATAAAALGLTYSR